MAERAPAGSGHRTHPLWLAAVQVAEQILAAAVPRNAEPHPLCQELCAAAGRLPAAVAEVLEAAASSDVSGAREVARLRIFELEGLLVLTARLQNLPAARVEPLLSALDRLRSSLVQPGAPGFAAASTPSAPAPAPPVPGTSAPAPGGRPSPVRSSPPPASPAAAPAKSGKPPPDRLVVDGCNFLGRAKGFSLGDQESRDRLLLRLQEYAHRHPAHRVTLFYDGQKTRRTTAGGVEQHFVSAQRTADAAILQYLRDLPAAERSRATLVTDDRELARRARELGVRVDPVPELAKHLQPPPKHLANPVRQSGLSRRQVDEWEEFFEKPPDRP
jgi:predicted RNA-binding protein with PIN domain